MYTTVISLMYSFVIIQCFIPHYLNFMLIIYTQVLSIYTINYDICINDPYVYIFNLELIFNSTTSS
jgi:hypothetical protein